MGLCVMVKKMTSNLELSLVTLGRYLDYELSSSSVKTLNETVKQHGCWGVHIWDMCAHAWGAQKSILGVTSQGLFTLLFEIRLSLELGACQLDRLAG